jgi:hypothetical protein
MASMTYIGLDIHKKTISYCVKDASGKVLSEGKIKRESPQSDACQVRSNLTFGALPQRFKQLDAPRRGLLRSDVGRRGIAALREEVRIMLKQKTTLLVFAVLVSSSYAVAQTSNTRQTDGAASSRVIMMVNVMASIEKTIDSKKAKTGDAVTAKATAATVLSDGTRVPVGSILLGHIDSIAPSEKKSDGILVLTFDKLQIKNGKEIPIKATVMGVTSTSPTFGVDDKPYDPSNYITGTQGDNKTNGENNQTRGPHTVVGLTLSGSPKDSFSATLTQARKNVELSSSTQLVVSVAAIP